MNKKILGLMLAGILLIMVSCNQSANITESTIQETVATLEEEVEKSKDFNGNQMGGMKNGGDMKSSFLDDEAKAKLEKVYNEVGDKYLQLDFKDLETGLTLPYNLFIPENYEVTDKTYPLIMFIGDATMTGVNVKEVLSRCIGAVVWATEEEQKKHESFVLVPVFPETLIDDTNGKHNTSAYIDVTKRLIESIEKEYRIDISRVYATGQSGGCMTTMYLQANNPDLFTATLLVDGQWAIDEIQGIKDRKFIYITALGDEKATTGQNEVKNLLIENNISFGELTDIDAKATADELNNVTSQMFDKGYDKNFITWKLNSTYVNGVPNGSKAGEHMTSFYYGYNVERVRDWLFEQKK
ncbi:MAG: hypothetical protein IJP71_01110 [Lachnospiraceae bacterium]|nr:hypothetical protein [Lachnospiraceae bacterium]